MGVNNLGIWLGKYEVRISVKNKIIDVGRNIPDRHKLGNFSLQYNHE